jgi:hypothetical protein
MIVKPVHAPQVFVPSTTQVTTRSTVNAVLPPATSSVEGSGAAAVANRTGAGVALSSAEQAIAYMVIAR